MRDRIRIVEPLPSNEPEERRREWIGVEILTSSVEEMSALTKEEEQYLQAQDGLVVLKSHALKGMRAAGRGTSARYWEEALKKHPGRFLCLPEEICRNVEPFSSS